MSCQATGKREGNDDAQNSEAFLNLVVMVTNLYKIHPFVQFRSLLQRAVGVVGAMGHLHCVRRHYRCYSNHEKRRVCDHLVSFGLDEHADVADFCMELFSPDWPVFDGWWRWAIQRSAHKYYSLK